MEPLDFHRMSISNCFRWINGSQQPVSSIELRTSSHFVHLFLFVLRLKSAIAIAQRVQTAPTTSTLQQTILRTSIYMDPTLQTLGQSLGHWQEIYVVSIVAALLSTFTIVVFAFHIQEHKFGLKLSNYIYVVASLVAVLSTIDILNKTRSVDKEKDRLANIETNESDAKIAQANAGAATANQKAQEASDRALQAENENLQLRGQVSSDETRARTAEATLAKANKDTSDFAHALAQQQKTMAEQAKVSPVLNDAQIQALANILAGYSGQDVILHSTPDTTVLRLGRTIAQALQDAGLTVRQNTMDMGQLYQGVSVAVHSPENVPPLANTLLLGLRQAGIDVRPVTVPGVPPGGVAIYLGPN